jgi:Family of unknown function (DUF6188)
MPALGRAGKAANNRARLLPPPGPVPDLRRRAGPRRRDLGRAAKGVKPDVVDWHPGRQDMAAGLALFDTSLVSAVAFTSGAVRIAFDDGHLLRAAPQPAHQAWTVNGPDGLLVACMPGGSWVWQPQS